MHQLQFLKVFIFFYLLLLIQIKLIISYNLTKKIFVLRNTIFEYYFKKYENQF